MNEVVVKSVDALAREVQEVYYYELIEARGREFKIRDNLTPDYDSRFFPRGKNPKLGELCRKLRNNSFLGIKFMSRVRKVHDRLAIFHRSRPTMITRSIRRHTSVLMNWIFLAQRYAAAAITLEDLTDTHIFPRTQLYGHAVECAFKAYLLAKNSRVPQSHDLVKLAENAENLGCNITELQAVAIVQLSSIYFKDIRTSTSFKARYPTEKQESRENTFGDFEVINELINSVCSQIEEIPR